MDRRIMKEERVFKFVSEKLICGLMQDGKKAVARKIVMEAAQVVERVESRDFQTVLVKAIQNIGPIVEVRSVRKGGQRIQVPVPTSLKRRRVLAIRWLVNHVRSISRNKPLSVSENLGKELLLAYHNEGVIIDKRNQMHSMAEQNRAFLST